MTSVQPNTIHATRRKEKCQNVNIGSVKDKHTTLLHLYTSVGPVKFVLKPVIF